MADKKNASVLSALRNLTTSGTGVNRGMGGRGFWPGDKPNMAIKEQVVEECICRVTGIVFDPEMIKFNDIVDPGVYFTFEIIDGDHEGQEVKGERFWIPANSGPAPTEGAERQRANEEGRFAAYLEDFCGSPFENWGQGIGEIQEVFEAIEDPKDLPVLNIKFETYNHEKNISKQSASGEGTVNSTKIVKIYREYSLGPIDDEG